ncbi:MAG: thiamine-phosphate kinase [Candidatus Omnitrophota bacterium]
MKELAIIDQIRKRAGRPCKKVKVGIGDDCAVLDLGGKEYLLWATDMLTEGVHFRVKEAGYKRIGRKAVAVNVSDIAAMGGVPKYITVTLGLPKSTGQVAVKSIYDGIFGICKEYGIKVIGGDTNRSSKLVIDISIIGFADKKQLVTRRGAKKSDAILVTGPVRDGRKKHLDFAPRLKESRFLTGRYNLSSMIDISDGIAMDLGRLCAESRTGARVYADKIPLSKGLSLNDALHFGESFELLFTMKKEKAKALAKKGKYFIIGEMVDKKKGVKIVDRKGEESVLKMKGFSHL